MKHKISQIVLIIGLAAFLQGCVPILAGVAAGGTGYYVGKQVEGRQEKSVKNEALVEIKDELERKQQSLTTQDKNVMSDINQRLVSGAVTQDIAVYPEVRNGVVILHGRVPSAAIADRVIRSARSTPGVTRIISNLVVVNDQQRQPIPLNRAVVPQQMQQQQFRGMPQQRPQYPYGYVPQQRQQNPYQMNNQRFAPNPNQQQNPYMQLQQRQPSLKSQGAKLKRPINTGVKKNTSRKGGKPDLSLIEDPPNENFRRPKVMDEKAISRYQDNDSFYRNYEAPSIAPNTTKRLANQPIKPYIPTPSPMYDNDSAYVPLRNNTPAYNNPPAYDPNYYYSYDPGADSTYVPYEYNSNIGSGSGFIDTADPFDNNDTSRAKDTDNNYELYYYY